MRDLGIVKPGSTIYLPFATYDSNDPSASATITGLAVGDIKIYKDGSVTERASTSGFTLLDTDGIDFDGLTGIHGVSIDLSDNTTASFYEAGAKYFVILDAVTLDAATVRTVLGSFEIGYPDAVINTTIATLSSQTSFTLTDGPAEDDALNGCVVCIHDIASAIQLGFAVVSDYTGSTKTVTLTSGVSFTAAAGDNIAIYPPGNSRWFGQTAQAGDGTNLTEAGGGGITDILNIQPLIPNDIDLANTSTFRIALMLVNSLDDLPTTGEIDPGTIDIDRKAIGGTSWTSVVSGAACSESAGMIYYDEVFDSGTGYAEGDSIRITFKSQKITVSANDYEISDATGRMFYTSVRQTMRGTDSAATASALATAQADLDTITGSDGVTLATTQANYAPSKAGDSMALTAGAVDDVWDEVLTGATHNITSSAGRRLRALEDFGSYVNGYVWVDTVNGTAGTTNFENGTINNPVASLADAKTIADSVGLRGFYFISESSETLADTYDGYEFNGYNYTIALGGQSVSGTRFVNANITGNDSGTNATATLYEKCKMATSTLGLHRQLECGLSGTITLAEAGTYDWIFGYSQVSGTSSPAVDVGTLVGSTNLNMRHYSGGIEVQQMGDTGTDNMSLEGNGQLIVNANCSGGTISVRGNIRITDNASGAVSIVPTVPNIDQIHQGEAQSGTANTITLAASASSTDGFYDPGEIIIFAGTGQGQSRSIIDYDGTTKVAVIGKDWRTNPDSTSQYVVKTNPGQDHVNEGQAQGGGASTITLNTAASATDDIYIGQTVFLVGGTGQDQSRIITDYNGTTKVATVHRPWETNPDSNTSYVMLPLPGAGDSIVNIEADTNELQTDDIPGLIAALNDPTAAAIAAAVAGTTCETEGTYTVKQILSIVLAVCAGQTTDAGATLKTPNGVATRVAATTNASNERTAMTLTPSS